MGRRKEEEGGRGWGRRERTFESFWHCICDLGRGLDVRKGARTLWVRVSQGLG